MMKRRPTIRNNLTHGLRISFRISPGVSTVLQAMPGGLDRWRKVDDLHSQNGLWAISKWRTNFEIINFIQIFHPPTKSPQSKWRLQSAHQSVASPPFALRRRFPQPDHRRNDQAPPATQASPARYLQRSDTLRSLIIAEMIRLHPPPKRRQPAIWCGATKPIFNI